MRIYISGSISGKKDYKKRFKAAQKRLERRGYEVVNPADIGTLLPESFEYGEYMAVDLLLLSRCDAIYMLEGWEDSTGAKAELSVAKQRNCITFFESEEVK